MKVENEKDLKADDDNEEKDIKYENEKGNDIEAGKDINDEISKMKKARICIKAGKDIKYENLENQKGHNIEAGKDIKDENHENEKCNNTEAGFDHHNEFFKCAKVGNPL